MATKKTPKKKTTNDDASIKQDLFAKFFVLLGDKTKAYRKVYNWKNMSDQTIWSNACRLAKNPKVAARIEHYRKELEESLGISKITILHDLVNIKDKCLKAVPVEYYDVVSKEKNQVMVYDDDQEAVVGVWQFDANGAIKAISEINKMLGYEAPKKFEGSISLEAFLSEIEKMDDV